MAELLVALTGEEVGLWERLVGQEVDLYLPAGRLVIEFDPRYRHSTARNHQRDQCKSQQLAASGYRVLRVREAGLGPTGPWDRFVGRCPTAWMCVGRVLADLAAALCWPAPRTLSPEQVAVAMARAARRWHELGPVENDDFLMSRPDLLADFVENLTRPGVIAAMITLGSIDRCCWRCTVCGHQWVSQVRYRSGRDRRRGSGWPCCLRRRRSRSGYQLTPLPGRSLADVVSEVAAEFQENLTRPGRGPAALRCGSADRCWWRCAVCGFEWAATVKNRIANGTGCPACNRARRRPVFDTR